MHAIMVLVFQLVAFGVGVVMEHALVRVVLAVTSSRFRAVRLAAIARLVIPLEAEFLPAKRAVLHQQALDCAHTQTLRGDCACGCGACAQDGTVCQSCPLQRRTENHASQIACNGRRTRFSVSTTVRVLLAIDLPEVARPCGCSG